jgi:hypothetical protein
MSSSWKGRSSYFSGSNTNTEEDGYGGGGQQYEASGGGKKLPASRLKRNSKQTNKDGEDDEYPNGGRGSNNPYYNGGVAVGIPYYGSGSGGGRQNSTYSNGGGGGYNSPYSNGGGSSKSSPYSNDSGGYGNSSTYSNGGGGGYSKSSNTYSNDSGYAPYNVPASYMIPQDGTRSPMVIQAKEVNVYGAPPGSQYDTDNYNDQRGRGDGGGRGFFGPTLHAVGHFFDRKFGLHDRD